MTSAATQRRTDATTNGSNSTVIAQPAMQGGGRGKSGPPLSDTHPDEWYQLLSVKGVAERLGVSKAQVYKMIQRGELAAVNIRRSIVVRESELRRFIETLTFGEV